MKKRMVSLLLALCLLLSCLPIGALAVMPEELYLQMLELGLVDEDGKLLETKQIGDLPLGCEEIVEQLITFSQSGSTVVLRYGEALSDAADNANAASITLEGYPLSMESFDENGEAVVNGVTSGTQLNLSDYKTTRKAYVFTGWYLDEELTQRVTTLKLCRSTTLYAGWSIGGSPFTDVTENDRFYDDVLYVYENGLMNGTESGLFSPNLTTTRAQVVTILHRFRESISQ